MTHTEALTLATEAAAKAAQAAQDKANESGSEDDQVMADVAWHIAEMLAREADEYDDEA